MDPKVLTESGWKALVTKFKIKDNGLQKALATYEKLDDSAHDDCLKTIGIVSQLANTLKKVKEVAAAAPVVKYLTDVISAAEAEKSDVAKAKAGAAKAQADAKAKAATDKKTADAQAKSEAEGSEDEEEQGDYKTKLLAAFQKVKSSKDVVYQYLVCDTKPHCGLMIAKRITPAHKQELTKVTGGGKRFLLPSTVEFKDGKFVFNMDKPIAGLARKLQDSIKNFTGKKLPIMVGTESAEDDEQGAPAAAASAAAAAAGASAADPAPNLKAPFSISGSVGQGGKNKPEDVQALQAALNAKNKAGLVVDGKCGPKTIAAIKAFQQTLGKFRPDGLVEVGRGTARALAGSAPAGKPPAPPKPLPPPNFGKGVLEKSPTVWHATRGVLQTNIGELKKAVRSEYASEHPTLVKDIEDNLKKLDGILDKLDTKLADSLAKANAAKGEAARQAALQECKALVAKHIVYVKTEPLIAHIDNNPFGVATNCRKVLTDSLTHVAEAISAKPKAA